jgi:hypothetical protein
MARLTLCCIMLAAALGHASQPATTLNNDVQASNFSVLGSRIGAVTGQANMAATDAWTGTALAADDGGICYKIRAYIFKRDDDHAPQFVRGTTCGPSPPRAKDAVWPKARVVPAD